MVDDTAGERVAGAADAPAARTLIADPRLVSILLLSGVGIFGTQLMPPALPAIQAGLGVSDARIGLVMTALFLPAFLLIPVVGAVSDIYGPRRVALVSLTGFGAAGTAIFVAPNFEVVLALRVVQGVCFAALTPLSVAFIGNVFSGYAGTTAQGLRVSTNGLVLVAAPAAAGVLAEVAWNYPFLVYAVAFPAVIVVHRYFPARAADDGTRGSVGGEVRAWLGAVWGSLQERTLLLLILGGVVLFGVRIVVFTVGPLLATRAVGLRLSVVGVLFSLFGVVRIVVAPQAGRFAALISRRTVFVSMMGVVAASLALFALAASLATLVAAIVVFSVGMSFFNVTLNDAVTRRATAGSRAGVVSAMQSGKNLANTLGPALAGVLLAATDFRTVFLVATALALGYAGLVFARLGPVEG